MTDPVAGHENDIAIVGMAARLPGARDVAEYWRNLRDGVESVRRMDEDALLASGESPESLRKPNYVPASAPLEDMEWFDGEFFGFSPKESAILDPQHRHFLECTWEAMESAGHPPERFDGPVGVFAGCGMGSYFYFNLCTNRDLVEQVGMFLLRHTGNDKDFLSTRVSYLLNLTGPSIGVQTACSTSLVAVHLACQSLLGRECDMALAGGVTIELPHRRGYFYQEGEILSPDGHCHAFDHRSQGTVFGSGAGAVVLRRLEDALADGDHIHAVIRSTAVNNDGSQKVGYLAPSVDGQAKAMVEAMELGGIDAKTIEYVECHGTGTYMGDPIEVEALTQAFRQSTDEKGFCRIGSVKTNIGHLDTAAGVASLIKATLAIEHGQMPPSLNYEKPNPTIDFENSPFVVNSALRDWPRGAQPRRAAVNSLGVGGTNAYVVLEEAPEREARSESGRAEQLLVLTARSRKALEQNAHRLADHLDAHPDQSFADVAWTLHVGRRAFDRRLVVAARDAAEAAQLLRERDPRRVYAHTKLGGSPSVVFMFPGGGAQYAGMGRGLYDTEPAYREHVDRGLEVLRTKIDYDPKALLFAEGAAAEEAGAKLYAPSVQLPLILITEYALARLWMSWGVEPAALIGHSMGENTAACLAGVLSYEEAIGLVHLRGKLMDGVPAGGMLSAGMPAAELEKLLGDDLDLASVNAPELSVASGPAEALDALEKELERRDVDVQRVPIDIAAHSRLLEPILDDWRAHLKTLHLRAPTIPFISNRTGTWITDAQATDPEYWVEHLRNTVDFARGIETLAETPHRVFLEVGPGRALSSFAKQGPGVEPQTVVSSLRHPEHEVADEVWHLTTIGRLWGLGLQLDLGRLWQGESRRRLPLPTYAFQRQYYFIEPGQPATVDAGPDELEKLEPIGRWGYRPIWKRRLAEVSTEADRAATWVVFLDDAGIGSRLVQRLERRGHTVVTVRAGDSYHKKGDLEYTLPPEGGREGYDALVRDLVANGRTPSRVVHLWLVTADESYRPGSSFFHRNLERGFFSLFFLAQALADESVPRPVHLTAVSNGMQRVHEEPLPYPEKATVLGPCKVIPKELPGVTCTSVDVTLPEARDRLFGGKLRTALIDPFAGRKAVASELDQLVEALEEEVRADPANAVVAHRDGKRWEQQYAPSPLELADGAETRLRQGGVYLVTGGLGGLGLVMAEHLARSVEARLVLVGRSALPERASWDRWLADHPADDATSRRIRRVRELEALGAEVEVVAADVTNLEQMRDAVTRARQRFGRIDGAFHTAGVIRDDLIQLKSQADVEDVFAPKIHGTLVLEEALRGQKLDFEILFSSTSTATAPAGQIDYVAANAFLNAYAESCHTLQSPVTAIQWGVWNEVGMAAAALGPKEVEQTSIAVHHPLFHERVRDPRGQSVLRARYSPDTHWILDEHRTRTGQAIIPGTGYIELVRAALAEYGEQGPFEIRDLFFIRPLYVPDGESREVRVRLRRTEEGYRFEVRGERVVDGRRGWELHAQAMIVLHSVPAASTHDLHTIEFRCDIARREDDLGLKSGQEEHLRFGPRWRVLRRVGYGDREALAHLELPERFASDLASFALHPALLDYATGFAMELIEGYDPAEGLWVPVSYEKIRVYGHLSRRIVSWVRSRGDNRAGSDFALFDVSLCDEDGRVLLEVEGFAIKHLQGQVDFAASSEPGPGEIELERETGLQSGDDNRQLSPAEQQLRRAIEKGIRPVEGVEALDRVLRGEPCPQVIVSSMDLPALIEQTARSVGAEEASDGATFARPELDSEYVEPRDEVERTLVGFWEELLGVDQVGVQDSFFDLGGHSLIAVRLFAKIKKAFQVEFPISVLFEAPTIEKCAELIRHEIGGAVAEVGREEAAPRTRYTHLVPMHPGEGGSRTPFFLVAGMFGNVLNLRHLAHLLGTDRPFYGLQARGLYGDQKPHESFEDAARDYIAEMRTVQPNGPYLLGGFSGGGLIAHEIGQQLRAAGDEVALLVMLDTPLPHLPPLTLQDRAHMKLLDLKRQGPQFVARWARERLEWERHRLLRRFEQPSEAGTESFHDEEVEAAFRRALGRYDLKPWPGQVVLFRPKLQPAYVLGPDRLVSSERHYIYPDNGWTPHVGDLVVTEVPGDHDSMVLEPNVRVMVSHLRRCLEEAEARMVAASPESAELQKASAAE